MVRNHRGRSSRGTISCVPNGWQLRGRSPKVRCLTRLGAHTNLDWVRRVCVYFGVCITTAVIEREFMNVRQADQACTEPRGTHARGSMSVEGGDRERDRAPVCPCRLYQCLHTSELTSRLVGHYRDRENVGLGRHSKRRGGGRHIALRVAPEVRKFHFFSYFERGEQVRRQCYNDSIDLHRENSRVVDRRCLLVVRL